ncbi:dephospho-CoA kinase-domain-containing protein [Peziza echinospora]|nr:dephospho-CoA kinase-domain-containing protein [Peziza echinospora]
MLLIGLTGSIATGKSTVSTLLSAPPHSLPIIDADKLARDAVLPGVRTSGYDAIVRYFGPSTPDLLLPPDPETGLQHLNRPALGRRVFGTDPEKQKDRKVLNEIIHPIVRRLMIWNVLKYWITGHWAVVLDVPLLFESGFDLLCGGVIVVGVKSQETQIERLLARDKLTGGGEMTKEDAVKRINSQMTIAEKVERVENCWNGPRRKGYVVWNDGSKEELAVQVDEVMKKFKQGRGNVYTGFWIAMPVWTAMRAMLVVLGNWYRRREYLKRKAPVLKAKI